ncbi:hypothetical protein SAMN05421786_101740 [Chryseobacterium ureilyticum]|uniref:Lipoprotein n=1 Tax=Chryseobacterium ureilyticum TaxID=373668 RepID=A0A1N7KTN0_9FLAO|nr:hypothetical protein [Chryseobacterium ureilyticum]SIS64973.1 hypothetical protein SAMN05421786_101740 [Chryseobacterium ureilyticum]
MIKYLWILVTLGMFSCIKDRTVKNKSSKDSVPLMGRNISNVEIENNDSLSENELEGEEEFISEKLFQKWKGEYRYFFQYIDHNGISSDLKANINLIKSDSCVFESWFEDPNDEQHNKNGYLKMLGHIYVSDDKNLKIIFLENTILNGGSPNLDPVFTLINKKNQFYIESFLTSPPHNGIIEMPIQKTK